MSGAASPDAPEPSWWEVAAREFRLRLAPRLAPPEAAVGRPDWRLLNHLALDRDNLPRVLAAMGFDARLATFPRGGLAWWPRTDGPVLMMHRRAPEAVVYVCAGSGAWRSLDNAQRGADLLELGQLMWGVSYGQAGWRLARCCGHGRVPIVRGA